MKLSSHIFVYLFIRIFLSSQFLFVHSKVSFLRRLNCCWKCSNRTAYRTHIHLKTIRNNGILLYRLYPCTIVTVFLLRFIQLNVFYAFAVVALRTWNKKRQKKTAVAVYAHTHWVYVFALIAHLDWQRLVFIRSKQHNTHIRTHICTGHTTVMVYSRMCIKKSHTNAHICLSLCIFCQHCPFCCSGRSLHLPVCMIGYFFFASFSLLIFAMTLNKSVWTATTTITTI